MDFSRRSLRRVVAASSVRALGSAAAFTLTVVIGRTLGAEAAGEYYLTITVAILVATVARGGWDGVAARTVAFFAQAGDVMALRAFLKKMTVAVLALGASLAIAVAASSPFLANRLFEQPALSSTLLIAAPTVIFLSLAGTHAEVAKGFGRPAVALATDGLALPALSLILVIPLTSRYGTDGAVLAWLIAAGVTSGLALTFSATAKPTEVADKSTGVLPPSYSVAARRKFLGIRMAAIALPHLSLALVGAILTGTDVGLFSVAFRLASLLALVLVVAETVLLPNFASAAAAGDHMRTRRLAASGTLWSLAACVPAAALFLAEPGLALAVFGQEFQAAAAALIVLTLGQLFNVGTGPVGVVLLIFGEEKRLWRATAVGTTAGLLSVAIGANTFGLVGAAAGLALGNVLTNSLILGFSVRARIWSKQGCGRRREVGT